MSSVGGSRRERSARHEETSAGEEAAEGGEAQWEGEEEGEGEGEEEEEAGDCARNALAASLPAELSRREMSTPTPACKWGRRARRRKSSRAARTVVCSYKEYDERIQSRVKNRTVTLNTLTASGAGEVGKRDFIWDKAASNS